MVVVAAAAAAAVGLTRELTGRPGVGSCAAIKDNHELRQSRTIMASAPARQSRTIMSFVNQGHSWRRPLRGNQGQS